MLLTKADEKTNSVLTITPSGIYYQELMTADRPQSKRVKLGKLDLVDGEIMPVFAEWDEFNSLVIKRRSTELKIKVLTARIFEHYKVIGIPTDNIVSDADIGKAVKDAAKQFHPDTNPDQGSKMAEINNARDQVKALHKQLLDAQKSVKIIDDFIEANPFNSLTSLNGKIHERVNKLISSATFKNKWRETTKGIVFQPIQTLEYFLESQAKDLLKRFNERLESLQAESGYLDIETAREIISARYDRAAKKLATR